MKQVRLPHGESVPALGLGTWNLGDDRRRRADEIAALRTGLDLGLTLIDTAEMYGDGRSEELVGEAIADRRNEVFLVSKVYPHNATRAGVAQACARSLKRLGTDRIDLYLLHWRGSVPLDETVRGFEDLQRDGHIRHWGVSNFDVDDLDELSALPGGSAYATDQVLYNLSRRGVEWDLLPWLHKRRVPVMAYSPVEQGRLLRNPQLGRFAAGRGLTAAQVALAWLLQHDALIAIPKAASVAHMRENTVAAELSLAPAELEELDRMFPPPQGASPLEML